MAVTTRKKAKPNADEPAYGHGSGVPHPIDVHVGKRVRMRRLLLGMNQPTLANVLGVTFQQLQKYERGANRVSASRLAAIAEALRVPISYFFADEGPNDSTQTPPSEHLSSDLMERPETIALIRHYYAIRDETVRQQALATVKALAEALARPSNKARHRGGRRARR